MAGVGTFSWTVQVGAQRSATFVIQNPDGTPYDITGATWEYVVRPDPTDTSATPSIKLTTSAAAAGVLTVNVGTATVVATLNPAATSGLPAGLYAHTLWMNPGTSSALPWVSGQFILTAVAQP